LTTKLIKHNIERTYMGKAYTYDDLVISPVSHEATEITKRILNIFNVPFFVPLWLRVKILVLTTASNIECPQESLKPTSNLV